MGHKNWHFAVIGANAVVVADVLDATVVGIPAKIIRVMKKFKNKSILIAPSFLRYDEEIKACFEKMGATVVMYDERPRLSDFTRFSIVLSHSY